MDERYGKGASQSVLDVDWIRDASAGGDIIISKDRAIAKRPLEAEVIYVNDARALVIASAQITGPDVLRRLLVNCDRIERQSLRSGPYVLGVHADTLGGIRLYYR